jgi:hypothetical protein
MGLAPSQGNGWVRFKPAPSRKVGQISTGVDNNIHIVLVELRSKESANVLFGSMGSGVLPVYAETLKAFRIFGSLRPIQSLPSRTGCTTQDPP